MIKISDGEMLDLLPDYYRSDPDWIAFSYALKMAAKKLEQYQQKAMMYAALDRQPAEILDYMATEKRSMFYDENAGIDKKRSLIRESGMIYKKAGTPSVVQQVIEAAFGQSVIIEWYDLADADPGEFDVEIIADTTLTPEIVERFRKTIESAKALTSHLRQIVVKRPVMIPRYVGAAATHNIRSVVVSTYNLEA